jgi:hypothetical protein
MAAGLFATSLAFETLLYADDSTFLLGIVCLLFGIGYLPWFANPLGALASVLLLRNSYKWAACIEAVALPLALTTLSIVEVPRNEAGQLARVTGYGVGFDLWLTSHCVLLATCLYGFANDMLCRRTQASPTSCDRKRD